MKYVEGLVSIVIPTHNRADLIERALLSAINQTYSNIEIIVVSDGSEDDTSKILEKYTKEHENLRFIEYHPACGGNHARNTGIINSKGEWVAFLDDDDEWHLDKIEKQIEYAKIHSGVGLICTAINCIYDGEKNKGFYCPKPLEDASIQILKMNSIGSTTTVMVKHSVLDECGGFDEKLKARQDYDLWVRACQVTNVGCITSACVEYHNITGHNQISWDYNKYVEANEYINEKYKQLRESKLSKKEIDGIYALDYYGIAKKAIKSGNSKVGRKFILQSLRMKNNPEVMASWLFSFLPVNAIITIRRMLSK